MAERVEVHPLLVSKGSKPRRGVVKTCGVCGKEFYARPSDAGQKYCSWRCSHEALKKGGTLRCANCGRPYHRPPSLVRLRGSSFCTKACYHEWMRKHEKGPKNRGWRGGRIRVDKLDNYFSLYIRARDGWRCQFPGCGKEYPRGSRGLHTAHFIGRAHQLTRYDPDNCVAFCHGHHAFMDTYKATKFMEFMCSRLGEERFQALLKRAEDRRHLTPAEKEIIARRLDEWLKELGVLKR
jgi:hypothetical protein